MLSVEFSLEDGEFTLDLTETIPDTVKGTK